MTNQVDASIRASACWDYLDCAWRAHWKEEHKAFPASVPTLIGTAVHASTGAYDQSRLHNEPLSIDDASGVAVDLIQHPQEEVIWTQDDMSRSQAEAVALTCHTRYCQEIAPHRRYLAGEEALDPLVVDLVSGIRLELTGHCDRRREESGPGGLIWEGISDIKTGVAAVNTRGEVKLGRHGPQLGIYTLLAEKQHGRPMRLPPEIIGLQTSGMARVATRPVPNAKRALIGTPEMPGFLDYIGQHLKTGLFKPNPKSILCTPKYCPAWAECPYHD